jgi:Na+-transporting methylmalonyl-CoA/oxaloacetate decarboxylase gamma subunit
MTSNKKSMNGVEGMKRGFIFVLTFLLIFLLAACSGVNSDEKSSMDMANSQSGDSVAISEEAEGSEKSNEGTVENKPIERMVIYKADLRMKVKNYEKAQKDLEEKAKKYGGFMIEANAYRDTNKQMSGSITLRVPQGRFQEFLHDAEGIAQEVVERNVNGQDVTEEYVDLESRLRSKRVVEERLLEFMKQAQKTEDLLKISNDLAVVQEEIERIVGRMNFLENQSALSTITITLFEENVIVPNLEKDDLNTWERTKKQFVTSANFLLSAFSSLFVFFIGNLPVFLLLALVIFVVYFVSITVRKRDKEGKNIDVHDYDEN